MSPVLVAVAVAMPLLFVIVALCVVAGQSGADAGAALRERDAADE